MTPTGGKDMIKVPAVQLSEKGIPVYSGTVKAGDLLDVYDVKRFAEESLDWYQRQRFDDKARYMASYLLDCPIAVVPSVLLGVPRAVQFERLPGSHNHGVIEFPRERDAVRVIDGQHRLAGFDVARDNLRKLEMAQERAPLDKEDRERLRALKELMDYDVPVVIVDSTVAVDIAQKSRAEHFDAEQLTTENAERVIFFILNKTQKGLNPTLRDQLAYRIWFSGIRGIPAIEEEQWRAYATRLVEDLKKTGSPLSGHIVDATFVSSGRRVRLSSFVTSLQWLFQNPAFFNPETESLDEKDRDRQHSTELDYLRVFWSAMRTLSPEGFREPSKHLLLRTLSVYAVNRIAADVFAWTSEGDGTPSKVAVEKLLAPLKGFDWSRDRSPIRAFGGVHGATEAYRLLLQRMSDGGNRRAAERLRALLE